MSNSVISNSKLIIGDSNSFFIKLKGFENLSVPGYRVNEVLDKLKELDTGETLIIGAGVNDTAIIKDINDGNEINPDIDDFKNTYRELLSLAKRKFKKVIVLGLLTSTEEKVKLNGAEIQYQNEVIVKYNKLVKELCGKNNIEFVDLLPYFTGREDELLVDHIHPNEDGKEIILSCLRGRLYAK
ncbi:MAG: SGNH/GDSL hydrolase family protein [Candidatus Nomurabacteria bacterium]|nr:MAG: SGNH/GDSL hydrolase family protein [Candidatus Nomurabacteria bacterium]HRV76136.1 SGNH/GDSL hydrolase family protein [Candidatus Saccharimonadales bacterium]